MKDLLNTSKKMITLPPTGLTSTPPYPWIMWHLWITRNWLLFEDCSFSEEENVANSIKEANEWHDAQLSLPLPTRTVPSTVAPPLPTALTVCHVDAACNPVSGVCRLGGVFSGQGSNGLPIISNSRAFMASTLVAEALAIREAVSLAASTGINDLSVFSDSQVVISMIRTQSPSPELKSIFHDIRCLEIHFDSIIFHYTHRRSNVIADSIAKAALLAVNSSSLVGV